MKSLDDERQRADQARLSNPLPSFPTQMMSTATGAALGHLGAILSGRAAFLPYVTHEKTSSPAGLRCI